MTRFDVIVIGAGPAGLAAAVAAASSKRVLLLDSAPRPGGQYWRHRAGHEPRDRSFRALLNGLKPVDYRPNTSVWLVEPGFAVHTREASYTADRIVVATGAFDRALPFPGWDLPGVVTAGGAQALLKGQGVPIGRTVVVSGAGPFLLPVAAGLARAGVRVAGVFEAGRPLAYLRHRAFVFGKAFEAVGYGLSLARHRIPYFTGHRVVAAHGSRRLEAVTINARTVECDALAVGYGFTPQIELAVTLGCRTAVDDDGSLVVAETRQAATTPGVYVAGEVTGVGGAALALVEGRLAGLAAAGRPLPVRLLRRRESLRRFASAMAAIHRVEPSDDDVLLCRCESVSAGAIRRACEELGVVDGRGAKLMTRAGMGWCQGRVCGHAVAHLVASAHGRDVTEADLLAFANRPIAQPITLRDLAGPADM